jgi:hypothetical protein
MSKYQDDGVTPKTRPEPQKVHLEAFEAQELHKQAVNIVMAQLDSKYPDQMNDRPKQRQEAEEIVASVGASKIMEAHNNPKLPSAEDLDAVAEEEKVKESTTPKPFGA